MNNTNINSTFVKITKIDNNMSLSNTCNTIYSNKNCDLNVKNLNLNYTKNKNNCSNLINEKKILRRTERLEKVLNQKEICLKIIKQYEEEELPEGKEIERLELIDKLRAKVFKIEKALEPYVEYQDAEYSNTFTINNKICIMDTDLDPLNKLLTTHVNNLINKDDIRTGYKCVTVEDVKNMLDTIKKKKDCQIFDVVVPKDAEQYEDYVLNIVEKTNTYCRKVVYKLMSDEYTNNLNSSKNLLEINKEINKNNLSSESDDKALHYNLHDKLVKSKKDGILNVLIDEDEDIIDLSDVNSDSNEELNYESNSLDKDYNQINVNLKRKTLNLNCKTNNNKKFKSNVSQKDLEIINIDSSENSNDSLPKCYSKTSLLTLNDSKLEKINYQSCSNKIEKSFQTNFSDIIYLD